MSTPVRSFIGGLGLTLPVHAYLLLNGGVFGISGFLHRSIRGDLEATASVIGLILGGAVGKDPAGPQVVTSGFPQLIASGLLIGLGSRLGNGCTSGHMICGISRGSVRSLVATATFFLAGVVTTKLLHAEHLPPPGPTDLSLGVDSCYLICLQLLPLSIYRFLYSVDKPSQTETDVDVKSSAARSAAPPVHTRLRLLSSAVTGFNFALALRTSNLTQVSRVLSFLVLPFHRAFDPSLLYLAAGAMPLSYILYNYGRPGDEPRLGGEWKVPQGGAVDAKLVIGAALFGVGWGFGGICPGPGLVNFGRALATGKNIVPIATWLASVVVGGLAV